MDDARLAEWMEGYIRAWNSNDPDHIGSLFADDSRYYTAPFRPPWMGREGIVQGWLESKDEPGQTDFTWEPLVVTDELAVVVGVTHLSRNRKRAGDPLQQPVGPAVRRRGALLGVHRVVDAAPLRVPPGRR